MTMFEKLPTLAELQATRRAVAKYDIPSRLADKIAAKKADEQKLAAWRKAVFARDKGRDRYTGKKVIRTISLDMNRAECHHIEPRENPLTRYDVRNGLLLSLASHQLVEQNKLRIVGTKFYKVGKDKFIDGSAPVRFVKGALNADG